MNYLKSNSKKLIYKKKIKTDFLFLQNMDWYLR